MTFRQYLMLMGGTTLLAWFAWGLVLWRINPDEAGWLGMALFFLTFTLGLVGVFATASMSYRVLVMRRPVVLREARIAFRQAAFLAIAAGLMLFLAARDALSWGVMLLVLVVFGGLEYLSLSLDKHSRT